MDNQDIRKFNLSLLFAYCATQNILGEEFGIHKDTIRYLMSGKSGKISDGRARQIERKLAKPRGWMDRDNFGQNITASEWNTISLLRRLDVAQTTAFLKSLAPIFAAKKTSQRLKRTRRKKRHLARA